MSDTFLHPSPHKHRTTVSALIFGFAGGPLAWTVQLLTSYALTSYACYPGPLPRNALPPGWGLLSPGLTLLDVATFGVTLAALWVSLRVYARTQSEVEGQGNTADLLEIGQGRSRFIAFSGVITSAAFAVVIVFTTMSLYLVPPCTR